MILAEKMLTWEDVFGETPLENLLKIYIYVKNKDQCKGDGVRMKILHPEKF